MTIRVSFNFVDMLTWQTGKEPLEYALIDAAERYVREQLEGDELQTFENEPDCHFEIEYHPSDPVMIPRRFYADPNEREVLVSVVFAYEGAPGLAIRVNSDGTSAVIRREA